MKQLNKKTVEHYIEKIQPMLTSEMWDDKPFDMELYYQLTKGYDILTILACHSIQVTWDAYFEDSKVLMGSDSYSYLIEIQRTLRAFLNKFDFYYDGKFNGVKKTTRELYDLAPDYIQKTAMDYIIRKHCC